MLYLIPRKNSEIDDVIENVMHPLKISQTYTLQRKITCKIFSSKSGNITHIQVEFEPLITNLVVPQRGDVPVRSCLVPKDTVENVWTKYT